MSEQVNDKAKKAVEDGTTEGFDNATSADTQDEIKQKVKRNRIPLSCSLCRKRKTKCDRQKPHCTTCVKQGKMDECVYSIINIQNYTELDQPDSDDLMIPKLGDKRPISFAQPDTTASYETNERVSYSPSINGNTPKLIDLPTPLIGFSPADYGGESRLPGLLPQSQVDSNYDMQPLIKKFRGSEMASPVSGFAYNLINTTDNNRYSGSSLESNTIVQLSNTNESKYSKLYELVNIGKDECVDFYDGFISMMYKYAKITNYGPLAWMSLVLKDPYIRPIREEVMKYKDNIMFSNNLGNEKNHAHRMLMVMGYDDIKEIDIDVSLEDEISPTWGRKDDTIVKGDWSVKTNINVSGCPNEKYLLSQILHVLPSTKVLWLLIDRFFAVVYPIFPYIDQFYFITDVETILRRSKYVHPDSEEQIKTLSVSKKLDFAILGELLMVLKLAEDSYKIYSDVDESIDRGVEHEYLQEHKLSDNIVGVAESCLGRFRLLKKCALPVFQLALLIREYEFYNGTSDVSTPESQIFISMLIQLGTSIGLNRDPSKLDITLSKGKLGNLWRKIWYGLVSLDTKQFILFGTGRAINEDLYDTQLPMYDESSSNIDDLEMEREIIDKIKLNYKFDAMTMKLANYVCSFKTPSKTACVLDQLLELEKMVNENFGTLKDILNREANNHVKRISKVWDISIYVQTMGLINCVYSHLSIHFQKLKNFRAAKYVRFRSVYTWLYVFSNMEELTIESPKYVGIGQTMYLSHIVVPIIHKGWISFSSTYVGTSLAIDKYENNADEKKKYQILLTMMNDIGDIAQWYLSILQKLSCRCFSAWKLMKAHSFITELIKNKRFIFKSLSHIYNILDEMKETDYLNLLELLNTDNYKYGKKESALFKTLKDRIVNNVIDHEVGDEYYSSNTDYNAHHASSTQQPAAQNSTNSHEVDDFWRNVFAQKQSPVWLGMGADDSDFKQGALVSSAATPNANVSNIATDLNTFDNTDVFVNRAIFDMFN